jgi:hypothetical protein
MTVGKVSIIFLFVDISPHKKPTTPPKVAKAAPDKRIRRRKVT